MRRVELGHWHYLTWHLPAAVLTVLGLALIWALARSLRRNAYDGAARALRWRILGWAALATAVTSAVSWPYLTAAATLTVDGRGTWRLCNYLGVPLAVIPGSEPRALRGADLGGLGMGMGHLEIRRGDGSVIRTVRISRETLDALWRALGYPEAMVHNHYGDRAVALHRYGEHGPEAARP